MNFAFDLDALTLEELELFEETTGVLIANIQAAPSLKAVRGLIWILRLRTEPHLKFDDPELRRMTVPELAEWSVKLVEAAAALRPLADTGSSAATKPARSSKPSRPSSRSSTSRPTPIGRSRAKNG